MKLLVTGACGFVGSSLIRSWAASGAGHTLIGLDNLGRPGSETNRGELRRLGVRLCHGDLRCASDLQQLPPVEAVIDAAANPSVLAGLGGPASSRQLVEHNLWGTINLLEYCREHRAALVLLSTSRVYSVAPLASLPVRPVNGAFEPDPARGLPAGLTPQGVDETFPTVPPTSLYGSTKAASEQLALEYGAAFGFPVWVNRCGVLAGAGQFGRSDQGIYSYWIASWLRRRPLRYIGFDGEGHQVRDCLHPADLLPLLERQLSGSGPAGPRVMNVSGGRASATSLRQLSEWCRERMGPHPVGRDAALRPYDVPWLVLDSSRAAESWGFRPSRDTGSILAEILEHAQAHPEWLDLTDG